MANILIFAGTTEGRMLAEEIYEAGSPDQKCFVSVATDYGKQLLPQNSGTFTVLSKRMMPGEMKALMEDEQIGLAIDATHPYAVQVSANIRCAAEQAGIPYLRLLRKESEISNSHLIVPDMGAAAAYLKEHEGKALLTIGSKELEAFTAIEGFQDRLYPRILPTPETIKRAFELGFDAGHLICMQGPFRHELNVAMLRQTGAKYLVTKESGTAGGFEAKLTAADEAGVQAIIIGRPVEEEGWSLEAIRKRCCLPAAGRKGDAR